MASTLAIPGLSQMPCLDTSKAQELIVNSIKSRQKSCYLRFLRMFPFSKHLVCYCFVSGREKAS